MAYSGDILLVPESNFTASWLEGILQTKLKTDAKLTSASSRRIGTDSGHLAYVMKISLEWTQNESASLPSTLVLKAPSNDVINRIGKDFEAMDQNFTFEVHNNECAFYQLFEDEKCPAKIGFCYFQQKALKGQQGILVMDEINGIVPTQLHHMTMNQTKSAVAEIAHLHAWSISNRSKWEGKLFPPDVNVLNTWGPFMSDMYKKYRSLFPETLKGIPDNLEDHFDYRNFAYLWHSPGKLGMPLVLGHGDVWESNLMLERGSNGQEFGDGVAALYDFQMAHEALPGEDISRLLRSSVSTDLRRNHFGDILLHYYSTLRNDLQGEPPFSFRELEESYQCAALGGMAMGFFGNMANAIEFYEGQDEERKKKLPDFFQHITEMAEDLVPIFENKETLLSRFDK